MRGYRAIDLLAALACLIAFAFFPALAVAGPSEPRPFASASSTGGLSCTTGADEGNVRFCPGNGSTERIPTWDGVPLDVDVTLPPVADGPGPYPTIVMLHGYGDSKTEFESSTAAGSEPETFDFNNDYYAQHGYAVVNYTARGFGESCGSKDGVLNTSTLDSTACLEHGFIHLADQRYEARDTEYLLGLLVDEGLAAPGQIGVTGLSYGGGQSIELAYLKNRIRCAGAEDPYKGVGTDPCTGAAENAFVPWTSPAGTKLEIDAAYARWPWSDLISALIPNGRFLDYDNTTDGEDGATGSGSPIGVSIQSYVTGLYADGLESGHYESPAGNPEFNITKDFALITAGEPASAEEQESINEIAAYHGGYVLGGTPAPLLMENGWNDDLFPPLQALRVYNSVREKDPSADVALQFGDVGHSRASNKPRVNQYFNAQAAAFFAERLKSEAVKVKTAETNEEVSSPAPGSVTTFTTTCPSGKSANVDAGAPDGGPYGASSWTGLEHGQVVLSSSTEQTITEPGGNPTLGTDFDPIAQDVEPNACKTATAEEPAGTANYSQPVTGTGFTLMGLPTVVANIEATGTANGDGQIDARLFDVLPSGEERLVSRGGFRLEEPQTPQIVFQLHGNGYEFQAGDKVKLELTSSDSPYYHAPNGAFTIEVKSATILLPTLNPPNGEQISPPESVSPPPPEVPLEQFPPPITPGSPGLPGSVTPTTAGTGTSAATTAASTTTPKPGSVSAKCASRRTLRINVPDYRHGRITSVTVLVDGKRDRVLHGRLPRTIVVSIKGRGVGAVTVVLRARVRRDGRTTTHSETRRFHPCVSGVGSAK
jgi:predicted acyl esterase